MYQRLIDFFGGFRPARVGRIDVEDFSLLVDRAVLDTVSGHIHQPEMLEAGGFHFIPSKRVAHFPRALAPTPIAQVKCPVRVNLIIAQQFRALENVVVVLEGRGQLVLVEDG